MGGAVACNSDEGKDGENRAREDDTNETGMRQ
jgi:hypothetical protein